MKLRLAPFCLWLCLAPTLSRAQTYAHEPFAGSPGTLLHGLSGGSGFASGWAVTGFDGNANQFRLEASPALASGAIHTSGLHLRGGYNNTTASRRLDVSGSFPGHTIPASSPARIGADGSELWVGVLIRKETTDDIQTALSLVDGEDLADINAIRVGVGYYGAPSNSGNQRFWSLLLNNPGSEGFTVLRSTQALIPGQAALLVLRLRFASSETVDLFVNPPPGESPPPLPTLSRTTAGGAGLGFRTLGFWSSAGSNNASLDEIRLGPTFASVVPTSAPPDSPGVISMVTSDSTVPESVGQAPVLVRRANGATGPVSVTCTSEPGTASPGRDFTSTTTTLSWADGDMADKTFLLPVRDDAAQEVAETIAVRLTTPTGGAILGAITNTMVNLLDNDSPASLVVENASFELPVIPDDSFAVASAPPGWTVFGNGINAQNRSVGVLNPPTGALYFDPIPDGVNVGVTFLMDDANNQTVFAGIEAGLQQVLTAPLRAHTRYTLRVLVGNLAPQVGVPFSFAGFPHYRVDLVAGSTVLASDVNTLLPGEGRFLESVVQASIGATHPALGQPLAIRLVNLNAAPGIEVNFDHVRLESTPIHPPVIVEEPGSPVLDAGGTLVLDPYVEGSPPFAFAWFKDDVFIATGAVLNRTSLSRDDSGLYRVSVTNGFGAVTSAVAVVRVREPTRMEPLVQGDGSLVVQFRDADGGIPASLHHPHFTVEATPSLTPVDWQPLPGIPTFTNGTLRVRDPDAAAHPRRYYRVVEN